MLAERGWTQTDLAHILGKPQPNISELINNKRPFSIETAKGLAAVFGNEPLFWLSLEAESSLKNSAPVDSEIAKRAKMFEMAPIKEMVKRGWTNNYDTAEELQKNLQAFFDISVAGEEPQLTAHARKTGSGEFSPEQRAWCYRAFHLARAVSVDVFSEVKLEAAIRKIRKLLPWPEGAAKIPRLLSEAGIRFVVIEPLPRSKIDGAAFWLDAASPVVAVSLRYDRIDSFWHTLCHELSHIRNKDGTTLDSDFGAQEVLQRSDIETRADSEASQMLIDSQELQSFILRFSPLYSRVKINRFANRIQVHPGIIVGQLQHRQELKYTQLRDTLVKVRDIVTQEALTDGWGHTVPF